MWTHRLERKAIVALATGAIPAVAVLLFAAAPAASQEEPKVFTEETQVVAVEVPVQVLVGGEPVRGLTADDFRVFASGELRPLTGFEVVDLSVTRPRSGAGPAPPSPPAAFGSAPSSALEVPPAGRRHFLLFFDLSFTRAGYVSRALESARKLVREGLHPSDLVGIAFYDGRQGINLALQFTPDRAQVERVLEAFGFLLEGKAAIPPGLVADAEAGRRAPDPLGLTAGDFGSALVEVGRAAGYQTSDFAAALEATQGVSSGPGGRWADNILSHSSALMEQAYEEQRSAQAAYLADNLKALAQALRGIDGPKHLVLLSQGFDARLLEVRSPNHEVGSGGGSWLLRTMNDMVAELRRSGWVIHGIDLGGIADGLERSAAGRMKASLFFLAEETGGLLVENTNDLAAGLEDVLERTGVTYVLTFQVGDVREDGAFHPIRVELADGPKGARLVHRTGYHAPRPPGERSPFELRAEAAARILAGDEVGGLPATVRATVLSYDGERARVPVLVEIPGSGLLDGDAAGGSVELYVYAFDDAGGVADFLAQSLPMGPGSPEEDRTAGPEAGVKLTGELELPPGRYTIRALVRPASGGSETVRSATLVVPAADGGAALLPPLFVEPGDERWRVAAAAGGDAGEAYPFVVEGKRFNPSAVPVLGPGQAARLLLPGVGLSREGVRLETRIVTEGGEPVQAGRLEILGRRPPAAGQPDLLVARFNPAGLPPGDYALEITLAASSEPVRARFRVWE